MNGINPDSNEGKQMSQSKRGPIVGIDLGTTNSIVAGVIDGKVQVLSEDDQPIIPSVVGLDAQGKMITGEIARNQLAAFPERTIASVKRKMGSSEKISLAGQEFTPQEISAMILRRLRDRATRVLGQPVERAVITVPAFFDENQRQATREAGLLAGLSVERIINEPTAATLVYHADGQSQQDIVVYDFGGGTFDVSVVRFESDVVEVLSSKGDTQLGGDDLDELLLNRIADEFHTEHGIDLRDNLATRYRLMQSCEAAKKTLSVSATAEIAEEFVAEKDGQPLNLNRIVTRHEFEEMIAPYIEQSLDSLDEALRDSKLTVEDIDDLVLVGGSTRIPLVARRLSEELNLEPSRTVNPDLAVALGAATQAAMFDGHSIGPVLVDINSHTLGIEVIDDVMGPFSSKLVFSPIIRRNSPLPASYQEVYSRGFEEQKQAEIHVLQGESLDPSRNRSIGKFMLSLETGSDISDEIRVQFDLTLDGILKVTATQPATGKSEELVIDNALSKFQGQNREQAAAKLGAIFDASEEILADSDLPDQDWQSGSENSPDSSIPNLDKFPAAAALLQECKTVSGISDDDLDDIQSAISNLRTAITKDDSVRVASLCEELDDILFYIKG